MTDSIGIATFGASSNKLQQEQFAGELSSIRIFNRAIVLHTLCDPAIRDVVSDAKLIKTLVNKNDYLRAPRNSIVCRISTEGRGRVENSDFVCFPFFSSHLMMPIKSGEHVWIFFEQPHAQEIRPYWISRIQEPLFVEDANFTHGDRRSQRDFKGDVNNNDESGNFDEPRKLKFQNGIPSSQGNATLLGDKDAFLPVIRSSKESASTIIEPVPRITKRPGDLVLQGSNNTSISLGTTMGWDAINRPSEKNVASIATSKNGNILPGTGAIDIVAGRGRYFKSPTEEKKASKKIAPKNSTRPLVEENVVPAYETDKNVAASPQSDETKGNTKTNPHEGDPDFLMDAARVFISSNAKIDDMLDIVNDGAAKRFEKPLISKAGATVAVKADHVRIVARKMQLQKNKAKEPDDVSSENIQTNGSIRIVKEGEANVDLASIVLEDDGVVQVSGSKIFLGRVKDDGGEGGGPGPDGSQPYVKYQQLENLLTKTFDDIVSFVQDLQQSFLSNTTPGFGAPNPALIKSANAECVKLLTAMKARKKEIATIKSQRIFGE